MNEPNKTHSIQSPSNLLPSSGPPSATLGSQVSTNNPGNYTTIMSSQNNMKQMTQQQQQQNHLQTVSNNGTMISNQNTASHPGQQFQQVQQIYRQQSQQQLFATQPQQQTRQVIVHQQAPQNVTGQATMISQVPSSHTEHNMPANAHAHSRYQPQMVIILI